MAGNSLEKSRRLRHSRQERSGAYQPPPPHQTPDPIRRGSLAVAAIVFAIAGWLAALIPRSNGASSQSLSLLTASPSVYDFGFTDPGRTLQASFELKNVSPDSEIEVTNVISGCGCLVPRLTSSRINPHGPQRLNAFFQVPAEPGPTSRTIRVEYRTDRGQASHPLHLTVVAHVRKALVLTPDHLHFKLKREALRALEWQSDSILVESPAAPAEEAASAGAEIRVMGVKTSAADLKADLKRDHRQWTVTVVFDPANWDGQTWEERVYLQVARGSETPFVYPVPILISLPSTEDLP